ncbi:RuvC-like resolvase [Gordonia phage VanLee]|uniref:RuvC-like resolvase n=1 Tax=Gordonia phage VanLee TaxID=2845816 RepID=A0A8F2DAB6_9CAUD|nr:RuvC-like resolvase [Gordonia phage VanLee]QWS68239.1 RuvC-like resolvase [Gordonia phage VanLee]
MAVILGVDPGSRWCGLCVREGRRLLGFEVIENPERVTFPASNAWVGQVLAAVSARIGEFGPDCVAVELLSKPSWHVGGGRAAANPSEVIATAQVLGAVQSLDTAIPVRLCPPGKMGSGPLGSYPVDLVSPAEQRAPNWKMRVGKGRLRHARSAWDVAGHGALVHRVAVSR